VLILRKVAVTGGLASGKTSVCRILESLGAYVVDSDEVVHQLLSPNTALGKQIIELLGSDVLTEGNFDRKKIAKKVFSEPEKLRSLEQHLHPAVIDEIEKRFQKIKNANKYKFFVAEIPLLYEKEYEKYYDYVIVVTSDPSIARRRFFQRDGHLEEEYEKRMGRQLPPGEKAAHADFVIINNGDENQLKEQVMNIPNLKSKGVPF
jgi:dephospho-CoA kinase